MASRKLLLASQGDDQEHKGDLSSMIDMVFLLLIFFMVSANFIKIKMDPRVEVPVADEAYDEGKYKGRIVLNVLSDEAMEKSGGVPRWADENYNALDSEQAITEYVKNRLVDIPDDVEPKLHVRGDAKVDFRHIAEAINSAMDGNPRIAGIIMAADR